MLASVYDDDPMQCRCGDCGALFNVPSPSGLPLRHALKSISAIECIACASVNVLLGQSRSWAEDRNLMRCEITAPVEVRASDWLRTGEFGLSAIAIHRFMTIRRKDRNDYPTDMGELRRCLLLLRRIPEWDIRIGEMKAVSHEWRNVVAIWQDLTRSFTSETGLEWHRVPTPKTEELLEAAISKPARR